MARLSPPRVRMPKLTRPGRASSAADEKTTATEAATQSKEPAKEGPSATPASPPPKDAAGATKPAAAVPGAPGAKAPDPNLQERMEGLQGWMAELERKQARTTYFGAIALLIAIAAAGAALYFGITSKNDSATKDDVDVLKTRVDQLQSAVTKNSKNTQDTLNNSVAQLQGSLQALQKQQAQDAQTISTLKTQVAQAAAAKTTGAAGTAVTPGATTTTPKKP